MKNRQKSGLTRHESGRRTREEALTGARRRRRLENEAAQAQSNLPENQRKKPPGNPSGVVVGGRLTRWEAAEVDERSGSGNEGWGRREGEGRRGDLWR